MRSRDPDHILGIIACLTVIFSALISVLTIPLWRVIHASAFLRLPPAIMTLIGGVVIGRYFFKALFDNNDYTHESVIIVLLLISLNMLATAAALFLMKHEPPRNPVLDQYAPDASEKM